MGIYTRLVVAGVLSMTVSPAAAASACTVITDPSGDVIPARGVGAPDPHLDILAVTVGSAGGALEFRIKDVRLIENRRGEWQLRFAAGRNRLLVTAGLGAWVNVGDYAGAVDFHAGREGERLTRVRGTFDYAASEIRVTVPFRTVGVARGTALREFEAIARETFAHVMPAGAPAGGEFVLADPASSGSSYVVGSSC